MSRQDEIFISDEGNNWFKRNQPVLDTYTADRIVDYISQNKLIKKAVLDIGASNGWRLNMLASHTDAQLHGIEPGKEAVSSGQKFSPRVHLIQGVSHNLSQYDEAQFDVVIISFVLHWVDRAKLLLTIAEIDRVLANDGYVIIQDFDPGFPGKTKYHHLPDEDIYTYKQPYWDIFTISQLYRVIHNEAFLHSNNSPETPNNFCRMVVLQKTGTKSYPLLDLPISV